MKRRSIALLLVLCASDAGCASKIVRRIDPRPGAHVLLVGVKNNECMIDHVEIDAKTGLQRVICK